MAANLSACGANEPPAKKTRAPTGPVGVVAYPEPGGVVVESLDGVEQERFRVGDQDAVAESLSIAPSGKRIAVLADGGLFVLEVASGVVRRLQVALEAEEFLAGEVGWSPDEQRLVVAGGAVRSCQTARPTDTRIYAISRDGSSFRRLDDVLPPTAAPVQGNPTWTAHPTWSPDGQWLHYQVWQGGDCETRGTYLKQTQMAVISDEGGKPVALAQAFLPPRASWSPDSTQIAYATDREGPRGELTTVDVRTHKTTVLGDFVGDVFWTRRGIYAFAGGNQRLMLVPASGDQPKPVTVFPSTANPLAAPLSGDWIALCDNGCETLVIYSHDGKRLIERPLRTGDSYPVVAEIPA